MSWKLNGQDMDRWSWTADDVRHVLTAVGTELREYVEQAAGPATVHVYTPPVQIDRAAPLAGAEWAATYEVPAEHEPWVRALDDRELFEWLESAGYVKQ